jgi:hypothetical protein
MKFVTARLKGSSLVCLGASAAVQLHGQGTVNFSNNGLNASVIMGETITFGTNTYAAGTKAPAGTTFSVALYFAPFAAANPVPPDPSTFIQVGASAFLAAAGTYYAGTRTASITPPGYFGWFQVKAWDTACGATYEQALVMDGVVLGISNVIAVDTGDPTTGGTPALLTGISPIILFDGIGPGIVDPCVPEPPALVLASLGAASLFCFSWMGRTATRRRRDARDQ